MGSIQDPTPFRLVLVEDNPADVYLIREALDQAGLRFDLKLIEDGGEALRYFVHFGITDEGALALIILDLNLPKYDGRTILLAIPQ